MQQEFGNSSFQGVTLDSGMKSMRTKVSGICGEEMKSNKEERILEGRLSTLEVVSTAVGQQNTSENPEKVFLCFQRKRELRMEMLNAALPERKANFSSQICDFTYQSQRLPLVDVLSPGAGGEDTFINFPINPILLGNIIKAWGISQ